MAPADNPTPSVTEEPRKQWVPPDFEELSTAPEVTAYAGTWD